MPEETKTGSRKHGRGRWIAVGAVIILAAVGHLYVWYWPRERPALLDPETAAGRLLLSGGEVGVWLPFPHQNVDAVARIARSPAVIEALEAVDAGGLRLPAFGPLAVPPARELAFVGDRRGERAELVARVYPGVAVLAQLAGRLAGNPWLAGGSWQVDGRRVDVEWDGWDWSVRLEGGARSGAAVEPPIEPGLAMAVLSRPWGPLPSGLYSLARRDGHLDVTSGDWESLAGLSSVDFGPVAVWAVSSAAAGNGGGRQDALVVEASAGSDLPASVVFHRGGGRPWELPGESLYRLTGKRQGSLREGDWEVRPAGSGATEMAARVLPAVERLAVARADGGRGLVARMDFGEARRAFGPILRKLSLLPIDGIRPWVRLAADPGEVGPWTGLSIAVSGGPRPAVHVRLWHPRGNTPR